MDVAETRGSYVEVFQALAADVIGEMKQGRITNSFCGAMVAALFLAAMLWVPAAFAQQMPPGSPQPSAATAESAAADGSTTMPTALPGVAGASHLYHVGATGYFLDVAARITLAAEQQAALNEIKSKATENHRFAQLRIKQAEQDLWTLTGSDSPDLTALEAKVREIEKLKGDQRVTFIRSVGEAARVLTVEQRAALLGTRAPVAAQISAPQGSAGSVPPKVGMSTTEPMAGMPALGGGSTPGMAAAKSPDAGGAAASGGHLGHHPGGDAAAAPGAAMAPSSAPMPTPAAPPGVPGAAGMAGGGMGDMMGGMMEMMGKMMAPAGAGGAGMAGMPASAARGGCMGGGCGPGAAMTPIYPSLMTLPSLTPAKRAEIEALATQQINEGNARIAAGSESLVRATQAGDHAAMQQSVGQMHEGLDQLGAGIAAKRVLSEGKSPRNLALDWFKREMNLASPIAPGEPHTSGGVKAFHFITMQLLIGFSLAMVALYFFKMRRAAALFGRLEGGTGRPPPGSSPPLAGTPGPSSPPAPPAGGAPPPAAPTPARSTETPPASDHLSGAASAVLTSPQATSTSPLTAKWRGQLRVGSIVSETPSVKTFRLVPSSSDGLMPFTFLPGQFLNLAFWIGGAKMNRSYSISSSPTQRDYVDLTVRREPRGAVSRHVDDLLKMGDLIEAGGPVGRFTFTGAEANSIVLVAGGVGITPMMSIARYLSERSWAGDIYLFYACRAPPDFIFANDLAALQRINAKLHVTVTMEHPEGTDWQGPRGRITRELLTRAVPNLTSRRVHLCGPPVMMDAIKALLTELGVPPDQVKTEDFGTAAPTPAAAGTSAKLMVPATGPLVRFSKNNKSSRSRSNQTVLELSEELGIGIEFSCRVGTCGVCKVTMTTGEVEMAVEDSLDADEKAKGIILACQAKPKADLVVEA